jgi:hypothetical protein
MNEINPETRLPYAKFDHSDTRIRQAHFYYQPDWRWEYVGLLQGRDYEAAERLRIHTLKNAEEKDCD